MIKNKPDNRNKRNLNLVFFALLIFFLLNILNSNYLSFATEDLSNHYLLGPGDVLQISVWGYPELTNVITVRPDGMISFPLIKEIKATGITPEELRQEINKQLCEVIKDAQISLIVINFRTINISVLGEVNKPGLYPLTGRVDVLKAISAAGGLTDEAGLRNATIIRKNQEIIPVDLEKLLIQNDLTQNYPLESGDSLFIPLTLENNIYVLGEVKNPGIYPIEGECTVVEAITKAGGYTVNARLKSCVVIRRFPRDEEGLKMRTITLKDVKVIREKYEQVIEINLEKILKDGELAQNIALQPQDVVFLPIRPLSQFDIDTILKCVTTGLTAYNVLLK